MPNPGRICAPFYPTGAAPVAGGATALMPRNVHIACRKPFQVRQAPGRRINFFHFSLDDFGGGRVGCGIWTADDSNCKFNGGPAP